jgi:hypothetical protein
VSTPLADLGPCSTKPGGCPGRLIAIASDDGTACEREACLTCGCAWFYNPAPDPPVEGMITMEQFRAMKAKRVG